MKYECKHQGTEPGHIPSKNQGSRTTDRDCGTCKKQDRTTQGGTSIKKDENTHHDDEEEDHLY